MWFLLLMLCPTNAEKNPFLLEQPSSVPIKPSDQTKVHLECRSDGMMSVTLAFCQAFCGTIQTHQCHYQGDGSNVVKLNLPLYGCGTVQDPIGTYKTNLTVKFYPCHYYQHGHGMKSDEIITTICHYNITTSTTTSTTETSTIEASTTTPDDVVVIPNPGRSDDLVDPKEDSNITINIQQSSVFPWLVGILALIILLSMLACCIYFSSKRRIRFIQSKNSNSGLIATKSESHLSSDSMDNTRMMVKSNVETQTEEKNNGMKRAKLDIEGEKLLKAQEQILTTILESTETETMETLERSRNIPIQLDASQRTDNDLSYFYDERNGFEAQMDFHHEEESSSAIASQETAFYQNANALKTTSFMR